MLIAWAWRSEQLGLPVTQSRLLMLARHTGLAVDIVSGVAHVSVDYVRHRLHRSVRDAEPA